MNCIHCGAPVRLDNVCTACELNQKYLKKAYNTSDYYYNIGLDCAKLRNMKGAISALKKSIKFNKANIEAQNLLGLVYYEVGENVEAIVHWVISSSYDVDDNPANRYLKEVQGNQTKLANLNQAVKKYNLTLQYAKQGNKDLALLQLKKVLSTNTHFIKGYLLLALLYNDSGNYDKACKALKRVLKIDPYNLLAKKHLIEIEKEQTLSQQEDEIDEFDEEKQEESEEQEIRPRFRTREVVERGAAADNIASDKNLEVGNYYESKDGKHSVFYILIGLLLGIAVMWFLIIPNKTKNILEENQSMKDSYSDELARKNVTIANLEEEMTQLNTQITTFEQESKEQIDNASKVQAYDNFIAAVNLYLTNDKTGAVKKIGETDLSQLDSAFVTATLQTINDNTKDEQSQLYNNGYNAYNAKNYDEAITLLTSVYAVDSTNVDALYYLGKAYEDKGDSSKAEEIYSKIKTDFPQSNRAAQIQQ